MEVGVGGVRDVVVDGGRGWAGLGCVDGLPGLRCAALGLVVSHKRSVKEDRIG